MNIKVFNPKLGVLGIKLTKTTSSNDITYDYLFGKQIEVIDEEENIYQINLGKAKSLLSFKKCISEI